MTTSRSRLDSLSDRRLFLLVFLPAFILMFATADRTIPYHIDPFTNVISAWTIAETGSPILTNHEQLAQDEYFAILGWVVDSPRGAVSQYPPGTALLTAPFYLLTTQPATDIEIVGLNNPDAPPVTIPIPPLWPASLVASMTTAIAIGLSSLSARVATRSSKWAIATSVALALGTGIWLNGAYQLWQHGPSTMWISLAIWLGIRERGFSSGLAMGAAILTRPPVAIIALAVGIAASIKSRSFRPALLHGGGAAVGALALLVYNYWLLDALTVSGAYGSGFSDNLTTQGWGWYAQNLLGGLFSSYRGLFFWSPMILVAMVGVPKVIRTVPGWVSGGMIGGVVLLLVQFRLNRYSGGDGFSSYRYPLESVVAGIPLLAVAAKSVAQNRIGRLALVVTVAASVAFHMVALFAELS